MLKRTVGQKGALAKQFAARGQTAAVAAIQIPMALLFGKPCISITADAMDVDNSGDFRICFAVRTFRQPSANCLHRAKKPT